MRFRLWLVSILAIAMANPAGQASGDTPTKTSETPGKAQAVKLPAFTPEREATALGFVAEHHPELSPFLAQLKGVKRDQYEQAIRELSQTREKLATIKPTDEALHALMLDAWKTDSQIKLAAAQLACAKEPDEAREAELKALLYKQVDLQRQIVEHNHARTLASLEGMATNIKWLKDNRDQLVGRRFQNLTHVRGKPPANKPEKSPKVP